MAEDGCIFRFINMVLDRAPQTLALLSVLGLLVVLPPILSSTYAAPDRKAADQGDASAQYNLGGMYYSGKGVVQNFVQAHKWCNLAAANLTGAPRESAAKRIDILERKMTKAQVAEAQKIAQEWKPKTD